MKYKKYYKNIFCRYILIVLISSGGLSGQSERIKGITLVAPPLAIDKTPMLQLKKLNANWVAIVPYGFGRRGKTELKYNLEWQWWGERFEGVKHSIKLAKAQGLKVMLKPQIYIPGSWPGAIRFESDSDWQCWEEQYQHFILDFAKIAQNLDVELFCIGTEFANSTKLRQAFWVDLIKKIRKSYSGHLTYAANWDEYKGIKFWHLLDYIGIDAYFPLVPNQNPTVPKLMRAWRPISMEIKKVAKYHNRQVIFTEYGYLSVDSCAHKNWLLEPELVHRKINELAQANAIEALFLSFGKKDFWAGGFYWKWYPDLKQHDAYTARDYSFQQKLGEQTIKKYFSQKRSP